MSNKVSKERRQRGLHRSRQITCACVLAFAAACCVGCSSSEESNAGSGGTSGTGGKAGSGGRAGSGGTTGSGGRAGSGGTTGSGGAAGSGGTTGSGGAAGAAGAGTDGGDASGDFTTTVTVPATANIFGSGHAVAPAPGGFGEGVLPILVDLPAGTGRTMTVTSVSGTVDYDGGGAIPPNGPDGGVFFGTPETSSSFGGISGITSTRSRFLTACFLDTTEPADPPPAPFVDDPTASVVDPVLRQTVFIGDGLDGPTEGTGAVQSIRIPDGATRVFFGFHDSSGGVADPVGGYGNNTGEVQATVTVSL